MRYHLGFGGLVCCLAGCHTAGTTGKADYSPEDTAVIQATLRKAARLLPQYPDSAITLLNRALVLSREKRFGEGIVSCYLNLGNGYFYKGLYDSAIQYYEIGREHAQTESGHSSKLAERLYGNIATTYIQLNDYQGALKILLQLADKVEHNGQFEMLPGIYNNISVVLMNMNDNDKALFYIQKGKEAAFKMEEPSIHIIDLYLNEAQILLNKGNVKGGKEKCQHVLDLLHKHPDPTKDIRADYLLGNLYEKEGEEDKAVELYYSILNGEVGKFEDELLLAAARLGSIYLDRNNYPEAERYFTQALTLAKKLNSPLNQAGAYSDLSRLYKKKGDYEKAMEYTERYITLRDSVQSSEKLKEVSRMEIRFRTAEKDKVIAENQLMLVKQHANIVRKNTIIGGLSGGVILIITAFWFFYNNRQRALKQRQQLALLQATTEGEEKERSRIAHELHDGIAGQLSSVKMHLGILENRLPLVKEQDVFREASTLLDTTVDDVRRTAHNLMPELLLKHGLSEATRIYCLQVQAEEGLTINYQYYGFIEGPDKRFELTVYRIIQELLQNIIKHAAAGFALVQLSQHNDMLDITVEDNGQGLPDMEATGGGMGLESIRQRVRELNGDIDIRSASGSGTTVYIGFNLKLLKNNNV